MRILPVLPLIAGCYKDTLDVAALKGNPFDPDYDGPAVFQMDSTWLRTVDLGDGSTASYQVLSFHVREELFVAPARYSVMLTDLWSGQSALLNPDPPGGNAFRYPREPEPGQEVCLQLRLSNNRSHARAETICATLP